MPRNEAGVDPAQVRKRLLELRAEILQAGDLEIEPVRADPADTATDDDAQALNEMNQIIASKRNRGRTETLVRVDRAIARLDGNPEMFGLCRECEEPIGKRLDVLPYVELCVECQGARDGKPQGRGRRNLTDFK